MEQWRKGKHAFLEEVNKAYDRIGADLVNELETKNTLIDRSELEALRTKAANVDKIEEAQATLVRHRRAQEKSRQNEVEAKDAEIKRLGDENARLLQELQDYRQKAAIVNEIKKQDEQPSQELQQAPRRSMESTRPTTSPISALTTPRTSEPSPSTADKVEGSSTTFSIRDKYYALVEKYNKLEKNHRETTSANEAVKTQLRDMTVKSRQFKNKSNDQERTIANKNDLIKRQEEELQRLRTCLFGGSKAKEPHREASPSHRREAVVEPIGVSVEPAEGDESHPASSGLHATMDVREQEHDITRAKESNPTNAQLATYSTASPPKLPKLPEHRSDNPDHDIIAHDTPFEPLEPHHSSSTEDTEGQSPRKPDDLKSARIEPLRETDDSPETPIVTSCRSVKKRKAGQDMQESNSGPKIKTEAIGSSPIGLAGLYSINESMDLDNIGEKVDTPRKRRRLLAPTPLHHHLFPHNVDVEHEHSNDREETSPLSHRIAPVLPSHSARQTPTGSALRPLSTNKQILPRTTDNTTSTKQSRETSDKAIADMVEDGENPPSVDGIRRNGHPSGDTRLGELLAKPSPPKPLLSISSIRAAMHTSKPPKTSNLSKEAKMISQQSEEQSRPSSRKSPIATVVPRSSLTKSSRPSIERSRPTTPRKLAQPLQTTLRDPVRSPAIPSRPSSTSSTKRSVKSLKQPVTRGTGSSKARRLRDRPLEQLSTEDFKVNPKYNQGYDHAFSEVVRDHSKRRCLQGCIKPECCGPKFLALAASTRDPNRPRTAAEQEEDHRLLEDYLGGGFYKYRNMTKAEQEDTWLKAKARDLSNKHGRHRHAYERRKTPPGFWDVEFPLTQEEVERREKEKEYEREIVESRYREAMRPLGKYMFRDE